MENNKIRYVVLNILNSKNDSEEDKLNKLKIIYESLNEEDKKEVCKLPFIDMRKKTTNLLPSLLEKDPAFLKDEIAFFNKYIQSTTKISSNYFATEWFLKNSSNKWLLENTEMVYFIFKSFLANLSITSTYTKIKEAFVEKLSTLSENEYQLFLESNIKNTNKNIIRDYIVLIFGYGSHEKINNIYNTYSKELESSTIADMGMSLVLRGELDLLHQYKNVVIHGINNNLNNTSNISKIADVLKVPLLEFIYDNFNLIDSDKRDLFIFRIVGKATSISVMKENENDLALNGKDIFDVVFSEGKNNPERVQANMTLYLLWRVIQTFTKEKKEFYVKRILDHAKEVGEYDYIRKTMLIGDGSKIIIHKKEIDMNNHAVRHFFKSFFYNDLQENLEQKPLKKRVKI